VTRKEAISREDDEVEIYDGPIRDKNDVTIEHISEFGYEVVRLWEECIGENTELSFGELTDERRADLMAGVMFILDHAAAPVSAQHDAWRARNFARLKPDDPRLVPFDQLPWTIQKKAQLWRRIVHALAE
jgi:hypothetical protein